MDQPARRKSYFKHSIRIAMAGLKQKFVTLDNRFTHDVNDEKRQPMHENENQTHRDDHIPHSLASLPAGLEVANPFSSDKEVYIEEKQPVQADKESRHFATESSSEKELCETPVSPDGWHAPWSGQSMPKRIFGMRAKVFWILLVSAVIVFGLGIGIGMGTSKLKGDDGDDKKSQTTSALNVTVVAQPSSTTTV
jgi:hypothetical protein